jgi:hypothetical protein
MMPHARRSRCAAMLVLAVALGTAAPAPRAQGAPAGGWRTFEGSWSATGQRRTLATEGDGIAAVVELSGAVTLTGAAGLSRGFRGEAIGFNDGQHLSAGRAMWTDAQGDRIFSVLEGEAIGTGRRILGTIRGGTGRYANATGDYALTWQYVVHSDDGGLQVQGRAVDLRGRLRTGEAGRP